MPVVSEKGSFFPVIFDAPDSLVSLPLVTTKLSLVVRLSDRLLPAGGTVGFVRVRLDPDQRAPLYNLSGDVCFVNLRSGEYTIIIEGEHYFRETLPITLPGSSPGPRIETITLRPLPSYPFPPATTLIRGSLRDQTGAPISKGSLAIVGDGPRTQTTERGEFVLAWPALTPDQVLTEKPGDLTQRFVKGDSGGKQLQLTLRSTDGRTDTLTTEVEEGTTKNLGIITLT